MVIWTDEKKQQVRDLVWERGQMGIMDQCFGCLHFDEPNKYGQTCTYGGKLMQDNDGNCLARKDKEELR